MIGFASIEIRTFSISNRVSLKNAWWIWLLCCFAILTLQLLTLEFDPRILQDEVQILDFGRTVWEPRSDWALSWNVQESMPVLTWTYPGMALQELAYRLSAPSLLGPRFVSVLAGLTAATCLFGWLLARKTPRVAALAISLIFVLDPIFNPIYRRGRIDGWSIAACLAACWLLCISARKRKNGGRFRVQVFSAGFLAGISPFLWATAPMLFPLLFLEFYSLIRTEIESRQANLIGRVSITFVTVISGGLLAGLTILGPILIHWDQYWAAMTTMIKIQARASVIQNSVIDLFMVYDPLIFLATGVALIIRRDILMIVALILAYFIMIRTMVYLPRVLYLLPYFAVILAGAATVTHAMEQAPRRKILVTTMLSLLLAWNIGTSLIIGPFTAIQQKPANDPVHIFTALNEAIGPGAFMVLLEEWEGYYAARQLGWRIFRAGSPVPNRDYLEFIKTMDYVIIREPSHSLMPQVRPDQLESVGFELKKVVEIERARDPESEDLAGVGGKSKFPYPDLLVFVKKE